MNNSAILLSTLVPAICFLGLAYAGYRLAAIGPRSIATGMTAGFSVAAFANLTMVAIAYAGGSVGLAWDVAEYLSAIGSVLGALCAIQIARAMSSASMQSPRA